MAKKKLDIGILEIQKGGRGNIAKKKLSDLGWSEIPTIKTIPRLLSDSLWHPIS